MEIIHLGFNFILRKPSAVVLGYFDGVHIGHQAVIEAARRTGLQTVVVTFAQHPCGILKGRKVKLLMTPGLKEQVLSSMGVDVMVYLDFEAVKDLSAELFIHDILVKKLNAKKAYCGFNYSFGKGGKAGPDDLIRICGFYGVQGFSVPPVCENGLDVSSTRIRKLIEQGNMPEARKLLGRPFSYQFKVIKGCQLGRKWGTPTINQKIPDYHIVPRYGVYASITHINGEERPSVTNIGVKPTVGSRFVSSETYIMDFSGDLYSREVMVDLIDFLRPEKKFADLEQLKEQIQQDAQTAYDRIIEYLPETPAAGMK